MLYKRASTKPLEEIESNLQEAAARHNFGVIASHDLSGIMRQKGVDIATDCRIFEVCNPHQAKRVLEANGAISTAMPCRISVYGTPGAYTLATILPSAMISLFDTPGLDHVAAEVDVVLISMLDESA